MIAFCHLWLYYSGLELKCTAVRGRGGGGVTQQIMPWTEKSSQLLIDTDLDLPNTLLAHRIGESPRWAVILFHCANCWAEMQMFCLYPGAQAGLEAGHGGRGNVLLAPPGEDTLDDL